MITEQITKLDAAQRQTDEAIRMFFGGRDTVSTHTLASAAAQILADLGEDRGFAGFTRNKHLVVSGAWDRWRNAIKRFENFFKHADKDATDICPFHPEMTRLTLAECAWMLRFLTGKVSWEIFIYLGWFTATYPELILDGEFKRQITSRFTALNLDIRDHSLFADMITLRPSVPLDGIL